MAATRCWWHACLALLGMGQAVAATLPEDKAEAMFHSYDGGGVKATGPALLVRKSMLDKVSLSAGYYVDMVSNASIDVVTTASPFKENRTAYDLGAEYVVRDATLSLGWASSREPDYTADTASLDVAQEMFGNMTTVSLGFSRGSDKVGKKDLGFFDTATHWQYRVGLTQILSPRWLLSANLEALADEGFLGSPYRAARVFGATVPERVPRTRSGRAVKLRSIHDLGAWLPRTSARAEYRYYWDNWDVKAHTAEAGASHYFGTRWLADASLRFYAQGKALFYSDNAPGDTLYVSRNRQLSTFRSVGFSARATYSFSDMPAPWQLKLSGVFERKQFNFSDFTDLRTGGAYSHAANVVQVLVSSTF